MVDMVVPRPQHRDTLGNLLSILMKTEQIKPAADNAHGSDQVEEPAPVASEPSTGPVRDEAAKVAADSPEDVAAPAQSTASGSDDVTSTEVPDGKPAPA